MQYKIIDKDKYYRSGVFRHFSEDCRCSVSMTARVDVTELISYSKRSNTKFYINFLYILCRVMNSRDDYKMRYMPDTGDLICYEQINPTHYVFHNETETCSPVYTNYSSDYNIFYKRILIDIEQAKQIKEYTLDFKNHPNWFDASYIPWLSYDSMNIELPDGNLYFAPIINWGRYRKEGKRFFMPVTVRMNHAIADGYLVAKVFNLLELELKCFCR